MQTLKEATQRNIEECVQQPGTHYFVVPDWRLNLVRSALYTAAKNVPGLSLHTQYDRPSRKLRVAVTREGMSQ